MPGFNYLIDPETSDYVLDEHGRPVLDETAQTPIQLALRDELGQWWGDLNRGSEMAAILRGTPPADAPTAVLTAVNRALTSLKASGRLVSYSVAILSPAPLRVHIEAVDGNRKPTSFTLTSTR